MDAKTLKTLEYDKILSKIQSFAVSACSKSAALMLLPFDGADNVKKALNEVIEAYRVKYQHGVNPVEEFDESSAICQKAVKGVMLTPGELLRIKSLLRAGRVAQTVLAPLEVSLLKAYSDSYFVDRGLEDEIDRCILSENEISDNASTTLRDIRRKIADKKNALKEKLSSYFRKSEFSKFMQDNLVTIRNDRFVLPVKSEYRSAVPGLIHDMSSSGATVFIEPFAVVETNNEIKSLTLSETAEIERILSDLSNKVANISDNIVKMQDAVISIDIIFAKMKYSVDIKGSVPIFNEVGAINLKSARHPLIDKKTVVPVSISVGQDYKILMITGPNTGGKTVCLKTVGLVCLMAYTGLFIPCEDGSEVAIFDNIFCDIGDEQSIAQSLSTFSSHIVNLVKITESMTKNTLMLLDELGGGTDPQEGAALAIGIIKYIEMWRSTAIITTHYGELKEYALVSPSISNASMQFDSDTFKPTYKLMLGIPGTSNALNIAQTLGLNEMILKFALENMNEEKIRLENLIKSAEDVKKKSEEELAQTELLKAELMQTKADLVNKQQLLNDKLDKINFGAKTEIKRLVSAGVEKADELIEELKAKVRQGDERALLEAKSIRKQLENMVYEADATQDVPYEELDLTKLKVGDKVFVKSLNSVGTILSMPDKKKEVSVTLGAIKTKVKTSELAKPIIAEQPKKQIRKSEYKPTPKNNEFTMIPEVNVIGYTVSEAIEIIEPHLVSLASTEGVKTLRIVHGKGTGALGKGLQQYLKTSPCVKSYRYGGYGEGDRGVTVVELN
ncbi:MAG: endonuclease MutS2 [Clostridiales bacterium]|nr:endonuclease MutS2 [Clostridiales bacterium]